MHRRTELYTHHCDQSTGTSHQSTVTVKQSGLKTFSQKVRQETETQTSAINVYTERKITPNQNIQFLTWSNSNFLIRKMPHFVSDCTSLNIAQKKIHYSRLLKYSVSERLAVIAGLHNYKQPWRSLAINIR